MTISLLRVTAALIGVAGVFAPAEMLVRLWFPHVRDHVSPANLITTSDDLGWSLSPSKTARHRSRYFDVEYNTNAMGFRDAPRSDQTRRRPSRILLYGDSLIFGWGVPVAARFSNLLEGERHGIEVWNHAVPLYGLDQQILLYQKEARTLQVDEVTLFVTSSTVRRVHSRYNYGKYKPMFRQEAGAGLRLVPVPAFKHAAVSLTYRLLSPFHLPYFLQAKADDVRAAFTSTTEGPAAPNDEAIGRDFLSPLDFALLRMAQTVARDAHHRMTIFAANLSTQDRHDLRRFCHDNGIAYLDVDDTLTVTGDTDEQTGIILGKEDKHWNVWANRLIADSLKAQMTIPKARDSSRVQLLRR